MSENLTLARPYARAVFALARERARLPQWSSQLAFAARAVAEPAVQSLLGDPRLDAQVLSGVLLPEISGLYDAQRAEAERVVKATVTSANPLDAAELAKLRDALRKRFGQDVELATAVDASLIGGAVIDAGDVVIDGSLRTKLARLGAALTQ
jgi:F-type H+-transporting ATPase subunit delta